MTLVPVFIDQPYRGFLIRSIYTRGGCNAAIYDDAGDVMLEDIRNVAETIPETNQRMKSLLDSDKIRRKLKARLRRILQRRSFSAPLPFDLAGATYGYLLAIAEKELATPDDAEG